MNLPGTKTCAWIFLTVSEQPTSLQQVIGTADAINHAIPMLDELRMGLGWLQAQGLIEKQGKSWLLTKAGAALRESVSHKRKILDVWDAMDAKFARMPVAAFQPDDLSQANLDVAYRAYARSLRTSTLAYSQTP